MMPIKKTTFLQEHEKAVIKFTAAPQNFENQDDAIAALNASIKEYRLTCNKGLMNLGRLIILSLPS